jgi:hypothetical protein
MEALIGFLGTLAVLGIFIIYNSFSWGFVLYKFYYWFLLPVFTSLPLIDFYQAVGLMLFISLFKVHITNIKTEKEGKTKNIISAIVIP